MELKYIVLTIIKIIISVPTVVLILPGTEGAALMGGHLDNKDSPTNPSLEYEYYFDLPEGQEVGNYTYEDDLPEPNPTVQTKTNYYESNPNLYQMNTNQGSSDILSQGSISTKEAIPIATVEKVNLLDINKKESSTKDPNTKETITKETNAKETNSNESYLKYTNTKETNPKEMKDANKNESNFKDTKQSNTKESNIIGTSTSNVKSSLTKESDTKSNSQPTESNQQNNQLNKQPSQSLQSSINESNKKSSNPSDSSNVINELNIQDSSLNEINPKPTNNIFANNPSQNQSPQFVADTKDSETIPDPAPLVVPGYNLPENIFNRGKPFYLEKDPLTGAVDFNRKNLDNLEYDYVDEEPSPNIFDKSNIDRKDGSLYSHRPSDVNQLTPNFHDFLNLPVKYNPEKYVYPLISSSYANTKIQGNINKIHNHKDDSVTTYKPTISPTFYTTRRNVHIQTYKTTQPTTTTTPKTTTTTTTPKPIYQSTRVDNLMNSPMNHPSYNDFYDKTTQRPNLNNIYLTTGDNHLTTKPPLKITTKKTMSLFEQLFGEYEEEDATEKPVKPPPLFNNLPTNKNKNKTDDSFIKTEDSFNKPGNGIGSPDDNSNILSGTNMGHESAYEYEDDYGDFTAPDNLSGSNANKINDIKPIIVESPTSSFDKNKPANKLTTTLDKTTNYQSTTTKYPATNYQSTNYQSTIKYQSTTSRPEKSTYKYVDITRTTPELIHTVFSSPDSNYAQTEKPIRFPESTTTRVTSLPIGDNHVTHNVRPIIVATNLKEQLNHEKVQPKQENKGNNELSSYPGVKPNHPDTPVKPFVFDKNVIQHAPSTSNIHIAPDQDTVSFVMGHHQNVDGGHYVGNDFKVSPYDQNPFRPLYTQPDQTAQNDVSFSIQTNPFGSSNEVSYTIQTAPENYNPVKKDKGDSLQTVGSSISIQPSINSETSLSIGVPVGNKVIPGQVMDEKLEINSDKIEFPKGNKVVFPDERDSTTSISDLVPPPPQTTPNREVLKLNSKPMFHQLPSDLTPPSEKDIVPPPRINRPRPPWDPRPGHFNAGRPEYARPPRPPVPSPNGEIYKRIDNLPNILPQFRPNSKPHPPNFYEGKYGRQPLLERPNNRPIGFFETLQPPPVSMKNLHNLRKQGVPLELRQNLPPYDYEIKMKPQNYFLSGQKHPSLEHRPMLDQRPDQRPLLNQHPNQRPMLNQQPDQRPILNHDQRPLLNQHPILNHSDQRPVIDQRPTIDQRPDQRPTFNQRPSFDQRPLLEQFHNNQALLDHNNQRPNQRPLSDFHPDHLTDLNPAYPVDQSLQPKPQFADDRSDTKKPINDLFSLYKQPPKIKIANRRNGEDDPEIETLQMIQAKQGEKKDAIATVNANMNVKDNNPLYVVYPVNSGPLKMDSIDSNNKETVVIGTRAELPLPPSKIKQENYDQSPLVLPQERHDSPILRPHHRPVNYPVKSDFPYPIERPESQDIKPSLSQDNFVSSNQWNTIDDPESRIVTGSKINAHTSNQISATLKTYSEKPIAVAYTPTEPNKNLDDKYSMPNYASPVISEIRPGIVDNEDMSHKSSKSEFTVSAIMHTQQDMKVDSSNRKQDTIEEYNKQGPNEDSLKTDFVYKNKFQNKEPENHRVNPEMVTTHVPQFAQDFQAPFQASVNLDSMNQGWIVVRDKSKTTENSELNVTTVPTPSTSEFDIVNFKPQLEGGFKPLYNMSEEDSSKENETKH